MSKRKEIILDEETEANLRYLSEVYEANQSKVIKALINVTARAMRKGTEWIREAMEEK